MFRPEFRIRYALAARHIPLVHRVPLVREIATVGAYYLLAPKVERRARFCRAERPSERFGEEAQELDNRYAVPETGEIADRVEVDLPT